MKIGVVSDTHGLLRPEAVAALRDVEQILHLGDIGKIEVLNQLKRIAPVTSVRGNVDRDGACFEQPETEVALVNGVYLYMLHNLSELHLDPAAAKFAAVLFGHTHAPAAYRRKGVLYFNPGSCGPRRFSLPVTLGLLTISDAGEVEPEIVTLACV
jgi:putative phosphoesterase